MTHESLKINVLPSDSGARGVIASASPISGTLLRRAALWSVLSLAAFLNIFHLNRVGINGFSNFYYSAAVKSMLTGWRHFFYLSLDPAGFLAVDKPPLALWVQATSAQVFGFHGFSLTLPQALAGVLSVYVLYRLVGRAYGVWAGLLAGLVLALTPISVVMNRSNFPESLLVLTLLLAAWAVVKTVETGSLRWLSMGAVLVGLGFNIKMLQILLVAPALVVLFIFGSQLPWARRLKQGFLALFVTMFVSLPWLIVVELTPPDLRPYIGGTTTNSVIGLLFGYNGIARLWGEDWNSVLGPPGPLRFFGQQMAGQASWLLLFAILGLAVAVWQVHPGTQISERRLCRRRALLLWSMWLIVPLIYFSISTFFHRYYLATMAPAIAALVGIGVAAMWEAWQTSRWGKWLFPGVLIVSASVQVFFLVFYPFWRPLDVLLAALALASVVVLVWSWYKGRVENKGVRASCWAGAGFVVGIASLLIAPTVWTAIPVFSCPGTIGSIPFAGPHDQECRPFAIQPFLDRTLVDYLETNRDGARYMAATYDMGIAGLGILETGEPFMSLGGYRGSDPILTVETFTQLVEEGQVRYYVSMNEEADFPQQEAIRAWVEENCPPADTEFDGMYLRGPCSAIVQ